MLEGIVLNLQKISQSVSDNSELMEMALAENDDESLMSIVSDVEQIEKLVADLEFRRMFSGELDAANCFLDIQAGSGGTEAQDWGSMLLRMYIRYAERKGFTVHSGEDCARSGNTPVTGFEPNRTAIV
jgi:peptide chain release factor 2